MANLRLPIQVDLKTRNSSVDKDSIVSNGFIEQSESGTLYTTKRPGIIAKYFGAGSANGSFYYNDKVYVWDITTSPTAPIVLTNYGNMFSPWGLWNSGVSYTADSDPVVWDDDENPGQKKVYYPATSSTNIPPSTLTSPNNIYWSDVPFGPTQYYGVYASSNGPTANSKEAAGYAAYNVFEPYKTCATKFPATMTWREFSGIGNGTFGADSLLTQQWVDYSPYDCSLAPFDAGIGSLGYIVTL